MLAIAVVVSLIFVGLEVQQNSQVSIETATQRLLSEQRAVQRIISANSDFACIYLRGVQDVHGMNGPDRVRLCRGPVRRSVPGLSIDRQHHRGQAYRCREQNPGCNQSFHDRSCEVRPVAA